MRSALFKDSHCHSHGGAADALAEIAEVQNSLVFCKRQIFQRVLNHGFDMVLGKTGQPELRDFRLSRLLRKQRQLTHDFRGWGGGAFLLGPPARPMPTELLRYRLNELFIAKRTPRECSSPQRLHGLTTFKPGICSKWRTLAVPTP
jgi:hypothetical protein